MNRCSLKHLALAIIYLIALLAFSSLLSTPVKSIFPYALPVVICATRCGWRLRMLLALVATGVAWEGQAFPTVPENSGLEFDEALITFTELTLAAVIASAVARRVAGAPADKLFD